MTLETIHSVIGSPESAGGQLRLDLPDGAMTDGCGQEAAPASPSQSPVKAKRKATNATSGLHGSISLSPSSLQSCLESRLQERLPTGGSMMPSMIWKGKVTKRQRVYSQLAVSVRRTNATGSGLWRTPGAQDGERGCYATQETMESRLDRGGQLSLPNQVKHPHLWPTPTTRDHKDGTAQSCQNVPVNSLLGRAVHMFPTPRSSPAMAHGQPHHDQNASRLEDVIAYQTQTSGSLNPHWVAWLMGYPQDHINCAPTETPSSRKSRQNLSKQQCKPNPLNT